MATSQNGYTANDEALTQVWTIPGTTRKVRLRTGSPGALLVHLAAWFDKNVEDIEAGQLDDWGYAERPIRGSTTELSNHASGTALDLNATRHPLGERGTFTAAQAAKIRAQLLQYAGCIRWGGDYTKRADEMHFEIVRAPEACGAVWQRLNTTQEDDMPYTEPQIRAMVQAELEEYGSRLTTAPTGTLTKFMAEVRAALKTMAADIAALKAKP